MIKLPQCAAAATGGGGTWERKRESYLWKAIVLSLSTHKGMCPFSQFRHFSGDEKLLIV